MRRTHFLVFVTGLMITVLTLSCHNKTIDYKPRTLSNKVILDWNLAAYDAMGGVAYQHSLLASRINAMVHLAMHDAVNAANPVYEQYAYKGKAPGADPITAAAYAAHTVLVGSFPDKKMMLDSLLSVSIADVPGGTSKEKGMELGVESGIAMMNVRAGDSADLNPAVPIKPSAVPGVYNVVPPFDFVFAPHWAKMRLFGLKTHDQFRPVPPPALNSEQYKKDYNEVKLVGQKESTKRTAEQTAYAKYWYEFSESGWNRIGRVVAADRKPGLMETARFFALLNMALADAYTAGWEAKFHYNLWRPFTAVRAAANDGNAETVEDINWEPMEPTPPVQDYPSTHSALGSAAAKVMASVFGNSTAFAMTSVTPAPAGSTRSFKSFQQAAAENADSRVMAGIHFRFACAAGMKLGDDIGEYLVANLLKPVK